jgi:hypothetical protein
MAALYYARNVEMPKAIRKPILIFVGDEGLYNFVDKGKAKEYAHVDLDKTLSVEEVFAELNEKYSVYIIRKPYQCSSNSRGASDIRIENQWIKLIGDDHVFGLPEAERVVDVIFGILAKETGRLDYFEKELKDRQGKDKDGDHKIAVVMKSLNSILVDSKAKPAVAKRDATKSVTKRKKKEEGLSKSISLLD